MQPKTRMRRKRNSKKRRFINGHLRLDKMYLFLSAFLLVLIGTNVGYAIYNNKIEIIDETDINTILTIIVAITNDVDRSQSNSSNSSK